MSLKTLDDPKVFMERPGTSSTYPVDHELPLERLLTVREVAELLNVRESWV